MLLKIKGVQPLQPLKILVGFTSMLYLVNPVFSLTCPSETLVKSVYFDRAYPHKYDNDLWYLLSPSFMHDEFTWNISFGTFYSNVTTAADALVQGQLFYEHASLKRKHPKPVWIPNAVVCEYMPEGSLYFISAVSPPEQMGANE